MMGKKSDIVQGCFCQKTWYMLGLQTRHHCILQTFFLRTTQLEDSISFTCFFLCPFKSTTFSINLLHPQRLKIPRLVCETDPKQLESTISICLIWLKIWVQVIIILVCITTKLINYSKTNKIQVNLVESRQFDSRVL